MKSLKLEILLTISIAILWGCGSPTKTANLSTPTAGRIKIAADESIRPLVEAQIAAFEHTYKDAHIEVSYLSEGEAFSGLLLDSFQLVIAPRMLTKVEDSIIKAQTIYPSHIKIAYDGIALIVNPNNKLEQLNKTELLDLLSGNYNGGPLVFDNSQSSSIRFVRDSLVKKDTLPAYFNALNTNPAVIDYIANQTNAVGLIGLSWISDRDDTLSNSFLKKVKVLALEGNDGDFYQPYQAYIAQSFYPLKREVYVISREARSGLGSGFMSYMAGDKGQRVVLKSGLVPATMPIRFVQLTEKPLYQ